MRILYINNDGGGFADFIDIETGTTVGKLFTARVPHSPPGDYLIRVNRQPTTRDQPLQEGDRVSITPTKIEGAANQPCSRSLGKRLLTSSQHASQRTLSLLSAAVTSVRKQVQQWKKNRANG